MHLKRIKNKRKLFTEKVFLKRNKPILLDKRIEIEYHLGYISKLGWCV